MSFWVGCVFLVGFVFVGVLAVWAALLRDEPTTQEPWWWPGPDQPQDHDHDHDHDDDEGLPV